MGNYSRLCGKLYGVKRKVRSIKYNYKEIILRTLAITGVLSMAVLAPNALQIIPFLQKHVFTVNNRYQLKARTRQLAKRGLIRVKAIGDQEFVSLTYKGQKELFNYTASDFREPDSWDGKWRVVIFDIASKKTRERNILRSHLRRIGFHMLQKSVWIFPYESLEIISLIREHFKIGDGVTYMVVEKIEGAGRLKEYFQLR